MRKSTWRDILEEIDTNKDGQVSFEEFCAAMADFTAKVTRQNSIESQDDNINNLVDKKQ